MEGDQGQLNHAQHAQSHRLMSHPRQESTREEDAGPVAGAARHHAASGQMPDALAHLLSAAEAATAAKK